MCLDSYFVLLRIWFSSLRFNCVSTACIPSWCYFLRSFWWDQKLPRRAFCVCRSQRSSLSLSNIFALDCHYWWMLWCYVLGSMSFFDLASQSFSDALILSRCNISVWVFPDVMMWQCEASLSKSALISFHEYLSPIMSSCLFVPYYGLRERLLPQIKSIHDNILRNMPYSTCTGQLHEICLFLSQTIHLLVNEVFFPHFLLFLKFAHLLSC